MRTDLEQWREPHALIETETLEAELGDPELRIADCTIWLWPAEPGDDAPCRVEPGRSDYGAGHIPGAVFLACAGTIAASPDFERASTGSVRDRPSPVMSLWIPRPRIDSGSA